MSHLYLVAQQQIEKNVFLNKVSQNQLSIQFKNNTQKIIEKRWRVYLLWLTNVSENKIKRTYIHMWGILKLENAFLVTELCIDMNNMCLLLNWTELKSELRRAKKMTLNPFTATVDLWIASVPEKHSLKVKWEFLSNRSSKTAIIKWLCLFTFINLSIHFFF